MRRFVLDASVALSWFVDPSLTALADRVQRALLRGDRAVVPHLWRSEMANGFLTAQRRGTLAATRIQQVFTELDILMTQSIECFDRDFSIQRVVATGLQFGLTAYDATYLETARELLVPLATLDHGLVAAARRAGVSLFS